MHSIEHCRDGEFGHHMDVCDHCGYPERFNNSCRDRHCPKCTGISRRKWVKARLEDLLPIAYYHVVFTLPHVLYPLSLFNAVLIYELLFECAAETLKVFADDPQWLGARIGYYGVLHTWGGKLWQHLHVHFIVTGGGLKPNGQWVELKYQSKFLFPVKALSKRFRGIFIKALKRAHRQGELKFPGQLKELENYDAFDKWIYHSFPKKWVVFAKSPFAGPEKVVKYLGLYTNRAAISNYRLIGIKEDRVHFYYKIYEKKTDSVRWEKASLPALEFIGRFLMHILPCGFHRIRHYGFLSNGHSKKYVALIRELIADNADQTDEPQESLEITNHPVCPKCKKGKLVPALSVHRFGIVILNIGAYFQYIRKEIPDTS